MLIDFLVTKTLYIFQLTHRDKVSVEVNDHRCTNQIDRDAESGPDHEWGHCRGGQDHVQQRSHHLQPAQPVVWLTSQQRVHEFQEQNTNITCNNKRFEFYSTFSN